MVRRNDYALHRICLRSSRVELQDEAQMTGTKMVRVKLYRGIQIQFWDSGSGLRLHLASDVMLKAIPLQNRH